MKTVIRRKVIVVPYVRRGDAVQFMVVKDRKHKEWTFVTGGVKARETDLQAAARELREETKNALDLDLEGKTRCFRFHTRYREASELAADRVRNEVITTAYSAFLVDVSDMNVQNIKTVFRSTKNLKGAYNENADLTFETLDSFSKKTHVWKFIRDHVLSSSRFQEIVQNELQTAQKWV
jgi:ADP-ribose pyrophosphatase YjhB (NUDIX family)